MAKRKSSKNCRPTYMVSQAGHLLRVENSSSAGRTLATKGKSEKQKRRSKGCLNGLTGAAKRTKGFTLSPRQKRNLPPQLQKAILAYHNKKG